MRDTDTPTPTDPRRPRRGAPSRHRSARAGWPVLLLVVGITAGVGAVAVHGGDRGFTASACDELEQVGPSGSATPRCATNG